MAAGNECREDKEEGTHARESVGVLGSRWENIDGIEDVLLGREKQTSYLAQKQADWADPWPDQIRRAGQESGLIHWEAGPGQIHGLVKPSNHGPAQAPWPRANMPGLTLGEPTLRAFGEFPGLAQFSTSVQLPAFSKAASKEGNKVEEREEGENKDSADAFRYVESPTEQSPPTLFSVFGRPLILGGSSGLGGSLDTSDLEPFRVVADNGSE